jgi:adenylate kinase
MIQHVTAVTGISGVGKSTFLRGLSEILDFQCLQASELIRQRRQIDSFVPTLDRLRELKLDENQLLMIGEFERQVDSNAPLVILDSHTLIEQQHGTTLVASNVFGAVGIRSMVFLFDDPAAIAARRLGDISRRRLLKSKRDLSETQEAARKQAHYICRDLGIPMTAFNPSQLAEAQTLLKSYLSESE